MRIRTKQITNDNIYIIAECGNQFNGDKETALKLIDATAEAGADAIKFIFWFPDEIMADKNTMYTYVKNKHFSYISGTEVLEVEEVAEPMFDLLDKLRLTAGEWVKVRDYALRKGVAFMSTVLSPSGVELSNFLCMDAIKLSSWDYNFPDLWRMCAWQDTPIIADTGPVTEEEIARNLKVLKENGNPDVALLHCFHTTKPNAMNMLAIPYMIEKFACPVGYSATDFNDEMDIMAVSLGASILEKRLTLDRKGGVLHDAISKEPDEFKEYVEKMHSIKDALGERAIIPSDEDLEGKQKWFRRIVASEDIKKGDTVLRNMLEAKRGMTGITPERIWDYVGRTARIDIAENDDIKPGSIR